MSSFRSTDADYVLGRSNAEHRRLVEQAIGHMRSTGALSWRLFLEAEPQFSSHDIHSRYSWAVQVKINHSCAPGQVGTPPPMRNRR